ncbi:FMN-linked oxidoreductase [Linderina pennispora]|uniref:tRNA-dihydrouridine synthase n=1 Tax=Linderina pennispora TaxID=61395 RepID=A0A1Y1WFL4_9FUNG|nr:FMN-linked oxidoreductase [Linderina pennispora]ORX72108.1 FMN-linked oxidoreductase [Linderina pennispora]
MIDVTDPCFLRLLRLISPTHNHQLWTEMIHANAFSRGRIHTDSAKLAQSIPLHELPDYSHGVVVQIGSSTPGDAAVAVQELGRLGVRHVNLNCGCPSRNVQMGAFGAVLMQSPELVGQIVSAMAEAATDGMQVSVKCRIGIDHDESFGFLQRFIETVSRSTTHPVSFVLHARRAWLDGLSPEQNRKVPVLNYERAYEMIKEFPHTSFVVNGGIDSVDSVQQQLDKADGVMLGRKIREDPWFLASLDQHIYGVSESQIPVAGIGATAVPAVCRRYAQRLCYAVHSPGTPAVRVLPRRQGQGVAAAPGPCDFAGKGPQW